MSAATVVAVLLLVGTVGASLWALYAFGLPLANPVVGGVLAFVGVIAWRVGVEQRQARALQHALASVIPPSVALKSAALRALASWWRAAHDQRAVYRSEGLHQLF